MKLMSRAPSTLSTEDTQPLAVLPQLPASSAATALWFAVQKRPWLSLAVLPAGPGESALHVANALYDVGALISGGPIRLLDARSLSMASSASFIVNMSSLVSGPGERRTGGEQRAIVLLSSVIEQLAGIPVVLAADAVLLTVTLGKTTVDSVRRTQELLGPERVIGSVLVPP
jgi:hypothetical protein